MKENIIFVDDDSLVLQGLRRQLHPMRAEWNMNFFESGPLALEFMAKNEVDIVVSDMVMPGMDGARLLSEVLRLYPRTVRIILSGQAEQAAVLRVVGPAHQFLPKPCDADELRLAIHRAVAMREYLSSERLKLLTAQVTSLPSRSGAQSDITRELQQEEPSLARIGEIVAHDVGLSAKILQLVHSAFFGLPRQITDPAEAVAYLGLATVRALAFSMDVFAKFDANSCRLFSLETLESHSWNTGFLARRLAHIEQQPNYVMDACFLAGLMHDVGQLVLATSLGGQYDEVIRRADGERRPLCQIEHEVFGACHAEVGAYLLGLWGLPNPVIEAVAWHHTPAQHYSQEFSTVLAVHVADFLVHEQQQVCTEVSLPYLDLDLLNRAGFAQRLEVWREASRQSSNA